MVTDIPLHTAVNLYQVVIKSNGVISEIICIGGWSPIIGGYYWLGNGDVGYMVWDKKLNSWRLDVSFNVMDSFVTHVVPYDYLNPLYGKWCERSYWHQYFETNFFKDGYTWDDFKKENFIKTS